MIVDLFAGGGGVSLAYEMALGRSPDIAVNHWPPAIAMHMRNHPRTRHFLSDIFEVNPKAACGRRDVDGLWMSPDCTDFSKAKNGKPLSKETRGLAWVAARWAAEVRPRVLFLENVEEFVDWGPLDEQDRRIPERAGETFRQWTDTIHALGYDIEHRNLVACDFGSPTSRKRLFLIARCDREAITWPEPTHGAGRSHPWRTAAECIDWSLECPSIFERRRPLAEPTLRRIAAGLRRFVLGSGRPFIAPVTHPRDARVHSLSEPVRTITGANRGELALVAPTLIQTSYGERDGQAPRVLDLQRPLGTVVAGGVKHSLACAFLTKHYGSPPHRMRAIGSSLDAPIGTITTQDHHALTTASLRGDHRAEVRALLERFAPPQRSLGDDGVVEIDGERFEIADVGMRMLSPRELFRAQGFPDSYVIDGIEVDGEPITKGDQIALAGNSVPPHIAAQIIGANLGAREAVAA